MNTPDPSRLPSSPQIAPTERAGSSYEEDLLRFLRGLSLAEIAQIQAYFTHRTRAGATLSDYDVAMNDLLQQSQALGIFDQDRALAQQIAAGEDVAVEEPSLRKPAIVTHPDENGSPTGHECVICRNPIHVVEILAPCGHYYGVDCITDLIRSAIRDETLFPPSCCSQNIPLDLVQAHLSQELIATFQQKKVEFRTLKRVYCSSPTCSRFLGPLSEGIGKVYTCPAPDCAQRTCAKCRGEHSGNWMHVCRPDAGTSQVLKLARAAGWARCPGCSQMIERRIGCNHMTCRCRTAFCYVCGARWKTCKCPQQSVSQSINGTNIRATRSLVCALVLACFAFSIFVTGSWSATWIRFLPLSFLSGLLRR